MTAQEDGVTTQMAWLHCVFAPLRSWYALMQ